MTERHRSTASSVAAAMAAALATASWGGSALAQTLDAPAASRPEPRDVESALRARDVAEAQAEAAAESAAAAEARARAIATERAALSADLASLGQTIVARETALAEARDRLRALRRDIDAAGVRLTAIQLRLERLAALVQRAAREPTPSLLAHPDRPVSAARSALLMRRLSTALEVAKSRAVETYDRIEAATATARRVEAQARAEWAALVENEAEATALLRRKAEAQESETARAAALQDEAARLRANAASLGDLARGLAALEAPEPERSVVLAPIAPPAGARPPEQFDQAMGWLLRPAAGDMRASNGRNTQRLVFHTRPYARVIAPWSGVVLYADDFKSGEKLVIIEPQKGYSILLEGLATLELRAGQRVSAGEPIGRMGGPPPSGDEFLFDASRAGAAPRERLSFEILRDGVPVDPAPWFGTATREVSGL